MNTMCIPILYVTALTFTARLKSIWFIKKAGMPTAKIKRDIKPPRVPRTPAKVLAGHICTLRNRVAIEKRTLVRRSVSGNAEIFSREASSSWFNNWVLMSMSESSSCLSCSTNRRAALICQPRTNIHGAHSLRILPKDLLAFKLTILIESPTLLSSCNDDMLLTRWCSGWQDHYEQNICLCCNELKYGHHHHHQTRLWTKTSLAQQKPDNTQQNRCSRVTVS